MDASSAIDDGALLADGQVVLFWLPDAGVKFAPRRAGDGGKQARFTGEITKQP